MATQEPHFLARDQVKSWSATPIGRNFHRLPSFEDFDLQNLLGFAKLVHVRIGCLGARTRGWGKQTCWDGTRRSRKTGSGMWQNASSYCMRILPGGGGWPSRSVGSRSTYEGTATIPNSAAPSAHPSAGGTPRSGWLESHRALEVASGNAK